MTTSKKKNFIAIFFVLGSFNWYQAGMKVEDRICNTCNLNIEDEFLISFLLIERLCQNCGVIEDEAHFILKCKVNQNLRESLFNNIELDNEFFFLNFSDEQKLVYLLNPASIRHVRVIGFYLKRSLELRTEVLLQHK
jgi:hypothetical protein